MSANRRKPPVLKTKHPEGPNRKALLWTGCIFGVLIIGMALLLILTNN